MNNSEADDIGGYGSGVTIDLPHHRGYMYKEGEILSPDGHCRPFDHRSKGTIFGSGTGVLVLRRLEDAIAEAQRWESDACERHDALGCPQLADQIRVNFEPLNTAESRLTSLIAR